MKTLSHAELLQLKRWNTPTIYNGWEQITRLNPAADGFNIEETRDFMPQMGPMVGYAVTIVVEPSNKSHRESNPEAWNEYRRYVAETPVPRSFVCKTSITASHRFILGRGQQQYAPGTRLRRNDRRWSDS